MARGAASKATQNGNFLVAEVRHTVKGVEMTSGRCLACVKGRIICIPDRSQSHCGGSEGAILQAPLAWYLKRDGTED